MLRFSWLFLFIIYTSLSSWAQTKESAQSHIQKLASKEFSGRGYVENGMLKSAKYIRKVLKESGVEEATSNYFQITPAFTVNSFPYPILFEESEDSKTRQFTAGIDFLLNPNSGDIKLIESTLVQVQEEIPFSEIKSNTAYYLIKAAFKAEFLSKLEQFFIESTNVTNSLLIVYDSSKLTWYPAMSKSNNAVMTLTQPLSGKPITAKWKTKLNNQFNGINIIGKVSGKRSDSSFFFTAHYDHLGMLGDHIFPGANDNASGVTMLLDLAKYYAQNQPKFDTYFLFTCGEELGLLGSYFYLKEPVYPVAQMRLLINLDMVGTGDEGITIVNATKQKRFYDLMQENNHQLVEKIKARGEACNSDHCLFDKKGVPSVFIYTLGGKQAYHDVNDNGKDLSLSAYEGLFKLITDVLKVY